ncbi:MAG: hypothetical protein EB832_03530 [Thaumarchaeota archaeon S14]|nr:MAG: hypothetical protein EB832_03530 [Thaumarchaeota archaeon S14]
MDTWQPIWAISARAPRACPLKGAPPARRLRAGPRGRGAPAGATPRAGTAAGTARPCRFGALPMAIKLYTDFCGARRVVRRQGLGRGQNHKAAARGCGGGVRCPCDRRGPCARARRARRDARDRGAAGHFARGDICVHARARRHRAGYGDERQRRDDHDHKQRAALLSRGDHDGDVDGRGRGQDGHGHANDHDSRHAPAGHIGQLVHDL